MVALSPDLVILRGHSCEASEYLLPHICHELDSRAAQCSLEAPKTVLAQHDSQAWTIGRVAVIYQAVLLETIPFLDNVSLNQ
jgi:hypothetical protein